MHFNKKTIACIILTGVLAVCFLIFYYCTASQKNPPPNIILIIADDMGRNDASLFGSSQIPTPNIDSLGYHGQILDRFYAQSICTPSRAALLTGNYPIRSGLQGAPISAGENRSLPESMPLLPQFLQRLGYETHLVGKWHLGSAYRRQTPTERGFDTHYGYWNGFVGYFDHNAFQEIPNAEPYRGYDFFDKFTPEYNAKGKYATDLFTQHATELIDRADKPLFLMLAHLAAHTGSNGTELGVPDMDETNRKFGYIRNEERRRYADIVGIMDRSVGVVMQKLSDRGMLANSIVLFVSDNGAPSVGMYANRGSNWPLRGIKTTEFEGGVRVAATIFSPLLAKRGHVNANLVHIVDLLPTLYRAAGGNVKDLGEIDGIDQWETLRTGAQTQRDFCLLNINEKTENVALIGHGGQFKIINASYGDFDRYYGEDGREPEVPPYNISSILTSLTSQAIDKLGSDFRINRKKIEKIMKMVDLSGCRHPNNSMPLLKCKPTPCLFDLYKDPCETHNIYEKNRRLAEELLLKLQTFNAGVVPQTNRAVDPNANPKFYNNTWCTWLDKPQFCPRTTLLH